MAQRPSWWVIPGAFVVLGHVVTLGGGAPPQANVSAPAEAIAAEALAVARDATGNRSRPLPLASLTAGPFVLHLPSPRPAGRVRVTLWRAPDGVREASPWLEFRAPVRADGTIPIGGVAAGVYDVRCVLADGVTVAAAGVVAPGDCTLLPPPATAPAAPVR